MAGWIAPGMSIPKDITHPAEPELTHNTSFSKIETKETLPTTYQGFIDKYDPGRQKIRKSVAQETMSLEAVSKYIELATAEQSRLKKKEAEELPTETESPGILKKALTAPVAGIKQIGHIGKSIGGGALQFGKDVYAENKEMITKKEDTEREKGFYSKSLDVANEAVNSSVMNDIDSDINAISDDTNSNQPLRTALSDTLGVATNVPLQRAYTELVVGEGNYEKTALGVVKPVMDITGIIGGAVLNTVLTPEQTKIIGDGVQSAVEHTPQPIKDAYNTQIREFDRLSNSDLPEERMQARTLASHLVVGGAITELFGGKVVKSVMPLKKLNVPTKAPNLPSKTKKLLPGGEVNKQSQLYQSIQNDINTVNQGDFMTGDITETIIRKQGLLEMAKKGEESGILDIGTANKIEDLYKDTSLDVTNMPSIMENFKKKMNDQKNTYYDDLKSKYKQEKDPGIIGRVKSAKTATGKLGALNYKKVWSEAYSNVYLGGDNVLPIFSENADFAKYLTDYAFKTKDTVSRPVGLKAADYVHENILKPLTDKHKEIGEKIGESRVKALEGMDTTNTSNLSSRLYSKIDEYYSISKPKVNKKTGLPSLKPRTLTAKNKSGTSKTGAEALNTVVREMDIFFNGEKTPDDYKSFKKNIKDIALKIKQGMTDGETELIQNIQRDVRDTLSNFEKLNMTQAEAIEYYKYSQLSDVLRGFDAHEIGGGILHKVDGLQTMFGVGPSGATKTLGKVNTKDAKINLLFDRTDKIIPGFSHMMRGIGFITDKVDERISGSKGTQRFNKETGDTAVDRKVDRLGNKTETGIALSATAKAGIAIFRMSEKTVKRAINDLEGEKIDILKMMDLDSLNGEAKQKVMDGIEKMQEAGIEQIQKAVEGVAEGANK